MMIKKFLKSSYLLLVLLFIYIPISILIFYSFNDERSLTHFNGNFSLIWYEKFFQDRLFIESIISSLFVAVVSTVISLVIGTLAAIGISKSKRVTQSWTLNISNIPLINADVVTAVSLMMLFIALSFTFGIFTLIMAHISFNIPYVIITILPRLRRIHPTIIEASLDLGASPSYTLRKVILPLITPAIVIAGVISFAMSFDDFIISYFTGGNVTNVATHIYTLKRLTPVVNAFGTILISIVALIVFSSNFFITARIHLKARNQKILLEKYRAKTIITSEKRLLGLYLTINTLTTNTPLYEKISKRIIFLENKIYKEKLWIKNKKAQIINRDKKAEQVSARRREKYHWLVRWPWRAIAIFGLSFASLGSLGFIYFKNNLYDLRLGIWGQYISNEVISNFEKQYQVKIKVENYDKNEILYNKMYTTNYDIIVPSDYMATKLITENRVEKLDWKQLMPLKNEKNPNQNLCPDLNQTKPENSLWSYLDCAVKKTISAQDYQTPQGALNDYAVPYFWGDLTILANFEKPETKTWLLKNGVKMMTTDTGEEFIDPKTVSWELLWIAAEDGKNILALNDIRSLYGIAFQLINQTSNPRDLPDVLKATRLLENLIVKYKKQVLLQSDEIVNSMAQPYNSNHSNLFDFAVVYNGDAIAAFYDKDNNIKDRKFKAVRPRKITNEKAEGTNIWNDVAMIVKNSAKKDLAYKFLRFVLQDNIQYDLVTEFGYNTPMFAVTEEIIKDEEYEKLIDIFLPAANYIDNKWVTKLEPSDTGFSSDFISDITDQYSRKISARLGG